MSNQKESNETLVYESTLDMCNKIRGELVEKTEFFWFYLYPTVGTTNARIMATGEFGGRLSETKAEYLRNIASEAFAKFAASDV